MDRRKFIKNTALAAGASLAAPYILPSGRLFAATGTRVANHVVFCLFAGGVRNLESVQMAEGNLMKNMLTGGAPISPDISAGIQSLPIISGTPLQQQGTLFKQFRYNQGPTGHYNGHTTALTGVYTTTDINLKQPPKYPTVFEYYRKHYSPAMSALNAWWVSNTLGPYPFLNYSSDLNYGPAFGANYIQPMTFLDQNSYNAIGNPKNFSVSQKNKAQEFRKILNANFQKEIALDNSIENELNDKIHLETFLQSMLVQANSGAFNNPWGVGQSLMNLDMYNVFFAEKILQEFKPELLVVNMQDVDIAHADFTGYCNQMGKADYALAHLWNTIQSTPGLANDTVLIAVPEHGRNLAPNTLQDSYGRYALDHTNDQMSREIFCLMLGPLGTIQQQTINTVMGESIDVIPTIAKVLGFYDDIPSYYRSLMGTPLDIAFV
jgi:hypothetical protein